MTRFNKVSYDETTKNVKIGAGLTWGQVYEQMPPKRNVLGGRVPGVGVAGFTLCGGD